MRPLALHAVLVFGVLLLSSCTARPIARVAPPDAGAKPQVIYVTTQRALDRTGSVFGLERPKGVNHVRLTVSVPATHTTGHIEWPDQTPDGATDFVVTDTKIFPGQGAMVRDLRARRTGRETMLFVHGYNNTLSEALYRFAQIKADFEITQPSALFSWASAGDARGYIYDRDSVLYARDDLEATISALSAGDDEVFILAHSMGANLAMEVMRQAAIRGDRRFLSRISGVVLIAPDIDPDLFRAQAEVIGELPQPFVIFTSQQDRALGLAGLLTGRKPRLGVIDGPESVDGLAVSVVDFTGLGSSQSSNHAVAVTSPEAVHLLRGMIAKAQSTGIGFGRYQALGVQP